ncbi:hypothetical protein [Burkholderia ubonensis]|uniref:hypothetical protein n=1 Tax=Burkholderia ubonensis TaxID=101571 RepID=UPI000B336A61|nr:hypothetical protein [Burkholderia ubonensis]
MKRATIGHAGRHARRDYRAAGSAPRRRPRSPDRGDAGGADADRGLRGHRRRLPGRRRRIRRRRFLARAGRAGQRALALSGAGRDDFGAGA